MPSSILYLPSPLSPQKVHITVSPIEGKDLCFIHFSSEWNDLRPSYDKVEWSVVLGTSKLPGYGQLLSIITANRTERTWEEILYITLYWCFHTLPRPRLPYNAKPGAPKNPWRIEIASFDKPSSSMLNLMTLQRLEELGLVDFLDDPVPPEKEGKERKVCTAQEQTYWQIHPGFYCDFIATPPPPKALHYTLTKGTIRHPLRPRPPRAPEPFYCRHVQAEKFNSLFSLRPCLESDAPTLYKWMNEPRVSTFWGENGPLEHQVKFIQNGLKSKHSFPVIGSWDDITEKGETIGVRDACYFEIYWVKEDHLANYAEGVDDYDRGVHVLVGEDWARGRLMGWMSCLIHYMFLDDPRTKCIYLEPRADNKRFIDILCKFGFFKEKEFAFPHKQAALVKLKREAWFGPRDSAEKVY